MNLQHRDKIVLLGFLSHFPVAGVAWQTLHYLLGFQRLGFEVYYVEAHGCTPSKLMQNGDDDGPARAAAYINDVMRRFQLGNRWCYHALYESRYFGLTESQLKELYRDAALIINLHGSHLPSTELTATNRLVYLGTDPVDIEIDVHHQKQEAIDYLKPHCAFFTYGENLGFPDCLVPSPKPFHFRPTRQPVIMDFWENHSAGDSAVFTTVGNWRQPWREVHFNAEVYRWSKHFEFLKFIDLPSRVGQPFELAMASYDHEDHRLLESKGWRVRHALEISHDLDVYRRYIGSSRGEFTVAKDQNVRLRSGWFSDRAVSYLAAGRPVITQETGFSNHLPTGEGLFGFSQMEDIVAAVEIINADYEKCRRAARNVARECFAHDVVLGRMLRDLGMRTLKAGGRRQQAEAGSLPSELVIVPISRWPTRLASETIQTAMSLPMPAVDRGSETRSGRESSHSPAPPDGLWIKAPRAVSASIVIATHNGLGYTKMCLTSLLVDWREGDELIIVDNASTDGTPDFLRELARRNPHVEAILNETNRGFAAGNNQGLARASSGALILLNNDTILLPGWRDGLLRWIDDANVGMVGPVTNRTCNEAQIDAPYRTFGELESFARDYTHKHHDVAGEIPMLALFCVAMRRDVFECVGPLDEQFETGMFEDDDYARRIRQAGLKILCVENVFVHHFGQASLGELCVNGDYDRVLEFNRCRFEQKWKVKWQPHGRRLTPEYLELRNRVRATVAARLPANATVIVVSKGDEELLNLSPQLSIKAWHFPQAACGHYANTYPADSAEAIAHLETLRAKGGSFFLVPKPALWWLEHYGEFKDHLERRYRLAARDDDTCLIFDLGGAYA